MGNNAEIIYLYAADVNELADPELFGPAFDLLDEKRKEKTERLHFEKDKRLSVGAGVLIRAALRDIGLDSRGISFMYGEYEKPYVEGRSDIFFNISHSGNMVICAAGGCEAGCDIEEIKHPKANVAERFFTDEEKAFVKAGGDEAFFRIWTLKESFMKATGKGLHLGMKDFSISVGETISVATTEKGSFNFEEFANFDGFKCAVCAKGGTINKEVRNVSIRKFMEGTK